MKKQLLFGILLIALTFVTTRGQRLEKMVELRSDLSVTINDIQESAMKGIYATGYFNGEAGFDQNDFFSVNIGQGYQDMFIARYDSAGTYKWVHCFGKTEGVCNGTALEVDDSANVYVCGIFRDSIDFDPSPAERFLFAPSWQNIFFAKYDSSGEMKWANCFTGGVNGQFVNDISIDSGSNIYICGNRQGQVDFDPGDGIAYCGEDYNSSYIAKYNRNGYFQWVIQLPGNEIYSVLSYNDSLYVLGSFYESITVSTVDSTYSLTSKGDRDLFIAKLSAAGEIIWFKTMGGSEADNGTDLELCNNELIVLGYFKENFNIGNTILYTNYYPDIFLAKFNSLNGEFIWAKHFEGDDQEIGSDIELDEDGNIYLSGEYYGIVDFDPGIGEKQLPYRGFTDLFFAKYDTDCNYIWAHGAGNSSGNTGRKMKFLGDDQIAFAGITSGTMDIDFFETEYIVGVNNSASNSFIGWYDVSYEPIDTSSTYKNEDLVKDINISGSSEPRYLVNFKDTLFFVANDGTSGIEIWKSDGTDTGTMMLKDLNILGNGIMTTDDINDAVDPQFTEYNGILFFIAADSTDNYELWKTDGSAENTMKVKEINTLGGAFDIYTRFACNSTAFYFKALNGNVYSLYRSDGTADGTWPIYQFGTESSTGMYEIVNADGKIFVTHKYGLYVIRDDESVEHIKDFTTYPMNLVALEDFVLFSADGGNGTELWKSYGSLVTTNCVMDVIPGPASSYPENFFSTGNLVYFTARNESYGTELWESDGTSLGTNKIKEVTDNNNPVFKASYAKNDSLVYFSSIDSLFNIYLWRTNGTNDGTYIVYDINKEGTGFPGNFIVYKDLLFFGVNDGNGYKLLRTSELDAGILPLNGLHEISSGYPKYLTYCNSRIFFTATDDELGNELWMYNFITDINIQPVNPKSMLSTEKSAQVDDNLQLHPVIIPEYATDPSVKWSVKKGEGLASIDANGLVSFLSEITANDTIIVSAISKDGSVTRGDFLITMATLGLENSTTENERILHIYPNPFNHIVHVKANTLKDSESYINVYNYQGKSILQKQVFFNENNEIALDLNNLKPGIYLIQLISENGRFCRSVIKN